MEITGATYISKGGGGVTNPFMYEIFQEITNQSLNIMTYGKGECRNPFMHEIF